MSNKIKIILKKNLSQATVISFKSYLGEFLGGRHVIEQFDGNTNVYLLKSEDIQLVTSHFEALIERVENVY